MCRCLGKITPMKWTVFIKLYPMSKALQDSTPADPQKNYTLPYPWHYAVTLSDFHCVCVSWPLQSIRQRPFKVVFFFSEIQAFLQVEASPNIWVHCASLNVWNRKKHMLFMSYIWRKSQKSTYNHISTSLSDFNCVGVSGQCDQQLSDFNFQSIFF